MERQLESQVQEEGDRRRMLEDVQSDKATISRALTQNRALKDQLAELQNGFVKLVRLKVELSICPFLMTHFGSAVIYILNISFVSVLTCFNFVGIVSIRLFFFLHLAGLLALKQHCVGLALFPI